MINLLRGELYKLFRTKCLYICSIVILAFTLMIYGMFSLADMTQQGEIENGSYGIILGDEETTVSSVWDEMDVATITHTVYSAIGSIIISIYVAIYVFGEYANGAIKNIVGKGYKRVEVFAAKYISTMIGTALLQIVMMLGVLLCELIILRANRLDYEVFINIGEYIAIQFLLGAGLTGIMVLINQICRNLGVGIAISICLIAFSSIITTGFNVLLTYLKINVNVCDYWLIDLITNTSVTDIDISFFAHIIICSIVWGVAAFSIGSMHFGKVDVK